MSEKLPPNWGKDRLTEFFRVGANNRLGTFVNCPKEAGSLIRINNWLGKLQESLAHPKQVYPAQLVLRACLMYQTCCELAFAGNFYAATALQRNCAEIAAYALRFSKQPEAERAWLGRDKSNGGKQRARRLLTHSKTLQAIADQDRDLAKFYGVIYERSIDFGGHPNPGGIFLGGKVEETDAGLKMMQVGLHGEGKELEAALHSCRDVGMFLVRIAFEIWPERVTLVGLEAEYWALRKGG